MTAYEKELLALAVEACKVDLLIERVHSEVLQQTLYEVGVDESNGHRGETLADALTALLRELGVEVPERPSEEAVEDAYAFMVDVSGTALMKDRMLDMYHCDPLVVLALLEGGES